MTTEQTDALRYSDLPVTEYYLVVLLLILASVLLIIKNKQHLNSASIPLRRFVKLGPVAFLIGGLSVPFGVGFTDIYGTGLEEDPIYIAVGSYGFGILLWIWAFLLCRFNHRADAAELFWFLTMLFHFALFFVPTMTLEDPVGLFHPYVWPRKVWLHTASFYQYGV